MTRRIPRLAAALVSATLLATMAVTAVSAHDLGSDHDRDHGRGLAWALDAVRDATERFEDVNTAIAAGYAQPPAPAPLHECISSFDGTGAMGFHFINGSLLDTTLDPRKPEVLVYAPDRGGRLHLVALEYVVFQAPWMAIHGSTMPSLFHQMFMTTGDPNRFEIPAFFSLHVWLFKHNPSGLFAPFNPMVSCDPGHRGPWHDARPSAGQTALRFACDIDRAISRSSTSRT